MLRGVFSGTGRRAGGPRRTPGPAWGWRYDGAVSERSGEPEGLCERCERWGAKLRGTRAEQLRALEQLEQQYTNVIAMLGECRAHDLRCLPPPLARGRRMERASRAPKTGRCHQLGMVPTTRTSSPRSSGGSLGTASERSASLAPFTSDERYRLASPEPHVAQLGSWLVDRSDLEHGVGRKEAAGDLIVTVSPSNSSQNNSVEIPSCGARPTPSSCRA